MKKTTLSLHVLDSDLETVENRLGCCQFTSEKIFNKNICMKDFSNNLYQVIDFVKNTKDDVIKFYSLLYKNNVSIFSEFINSDNIFDIAASYFTDINNYVIAFAAVNYQDLYIKIYKKGRLLGEISICQNYKLFDMKKCPVFLKRSLERNKEYIMCCGVQEVCKMLMDDWGVPLCLNLNTAMKNPNVSISEYIL